MATKKYGDRTWNVTEVKATYTYQIGAEQNVGSGVYALMDEKGGAQMGWYHNSGTIDFSDKIDIIGIEGTGLGSGLPWNYSAGYSYASGTLVYTGSSVSINNITQVSGGETLTFNLTYYISGSEVFDEKSATEPVKADAGTSSKLPTGGTGEYTYSANFSAKGSWDEILKSNPNAVISGVLVYDIRGVQLKAKVTAYEWKGNTITVEAIYTDTNAAFAIISWSDGVEKGDSGQIPLTITSSPKESAYDDVTAEVEKLTDLLRVAMKSEAEVKMELRLAEKAKALSEKFAKKEEVYAVEYDKLFDDRMAVAAYFKNSRDVMDTVIALNKDFLINSFRTAANELASNENLSVDDRLRLATMHSLFAKLNDKVEENSSTVEEADAMTAANIGKSIGEYEFKIGPEAFLAKVEKPKFGLSFDGSYISVNFDGNSHEWTEFKSVFETAKGR
jgi:hypothetical protein